ncbi:MAG: multiheme c-type cytochrome [Planctomycetota bacterium]
MNLPIRIGVVALVLGAFGGAIAWLSGGQPARAAHGATAVRWESSAQCRDCHQDVYDEWFGSHHRIAYTNPEVRDLSDDFRKEECMDCHLPRPLVVTGFGKRTLPRRTHFDEGVSCISCHLGPDGGILARNDRPEVPCQPQRSADFFAAEACASCHNQHGTTDQWRASHFAQQGTDCSSCHMPEVARVRKDGSKRMGRKHVYEGGHDLATLKKAGQFDVRRDGDGVVLSLRNVAAGHNFPTEERPRAVDMMYRFVTAEGVGDWQRAWRFRNPYRDETTPINPGNASGENAQLPSGEQKDVRVPIPAGAVAVEARLWYRLTPFVGDADPKSSLLEERRVELQ